MQALVSTVVALWHHGPCVLIGRRANHEVPRAHTLAIRTVSNLDDRVRLVRERANLDDDAARRRVHRVDAERNAFSHRFFGCDIDAPDLYDLAINTSYMAVETAAAEVITAAYRHKLRRESVEAGRTV